MNWIEKAFGISPDGGNGVTEMLLAVGLAVVLATAVAATLRRVRALRTK